MTDDTPSKTRRKKDMHDLQDLGAELVLLKDDELEALDLPESLYAAILDARRITKFEARRRQMQYIGRLMRHVDPAPIRTVLDARRQSAQADTARLHLIEEWRERLIAEENALDAFAAEYPRANVARLKTLAGEARHEREAERPPRSFRALFQLIRDTIADGS